MNHVKVVAFGSQINITTTGSDKYLSQRSGPLSKLLRLSAAWEFKLLKPKFHYADFVTKSVTSSQQSRGHKSRKSATQITSPTFMICVADFRYLCQRQSHHGLCRRLCPCIVTNQIPLQQHKRVCRGLVMDFCCKHLDMSRQFLSATFVICVHDLSLRGNFGKSRHNGIWA